jgi:hypothetical protein
MTAGSSTPTLTGVTSASSQSLNRLATLQARPARGFRNPANQRRRGPPAATRMITVASQGRTLG